MDSDFDSTLRNWNKTTLLSLKDHIQLPTDIVEKKAYQNRLAAFKALQKIGNNTDADSNSIRYKFLKVLKSDGHKKSEKFYIIEANKSGEVIELRNYAIFPNNEKKFDIDVYTFFKRKWTKTSFIKQVALNIDDDNFDSSKAKYGLGFNQDDVIITTFINYDIKNSHYFPYGTLSATSPIKSILLLD